MTFSPGCPQSTWQQMCEWSRRRRGGETGSFSFGQRLSSSRLPRLSSRRLPRYSSRRDYHSSQFNWFAETDVVRFDWIVELLSTQSGILQPLNRCLNKSFVHRHKLLTMVAGTASKRPQLLRRWEGSFVGAAADWGMVVGPGGRMVGGRTPLRLHPHQKDIAPHSAVARLNF